MGEAKRRKEAGDRISWCRSCTLCCTLPDIQSLQKPIYKPCPHLAGQGCGIFGKPERPRVCVAFRCAYLAARSSGSPDRHLIPHPQEAGAYFNVDPRERLIVLFVDPAMAERWKTSGIVAYLRPLIARGFQLQIIDRGRKMTISTPDLLEETIRMDYVAYADAQGWAREIPEFLQYFGSGRAEGDR